MHMTAYLVIQANIKDESLYEQFRNVVIDIYKAYDATVLAADNDSELLEGTQQYQRVVIVGFEDSRKLKAWYHSMRLKGINKLRRAAADATMTYVHGVKHL